MCRYCGMDPDKVVMTLESREDIKALVLAPGLKDPVRELTMPPEGGG